MATLTMATTATMAAGMASERSKRRVRVAGMGEQVIADIVQRLAARACSPLGRDDLDQLALAGIDLGVAAVPVDGDLLELDVALLEVGDGLAHLRAGEQIEVGLPGVVGEFLAFLGQQEQREQLGGGGMLRVPGHAKIVVAPLRG